MNQSIGNIDCSNVSNVNTYTHTEWNAPKKGMSHNIIVALSFTFSALALVFSIISLCSAKIHNFNADNAMLSSIGIIVAALIGIVAFLAAWQIWNTIEFKNKTEEIVRTYTYRGSRSALFVSLAQQGNIFYHKHEKADSTKLILNALCVWERERFDSDLEKEALDFCLSAIKEYKEEGWSFTVSSSDEKDAYIRAALNVGDKDVISFVNKIKIARCDENYQESK